MESSTAGASATKTCPFCAEQIQAAAIKCRFCGSMLESAAVPVPAVSASSASSGAQAAAPLRVSRARVFAKTCHLLALGWTVFCAVGVVTGMANASNELGGDFSGAAAIGVGLGLGFWAFLWFVPVVGLEVVAIAATATAKRSPADDATSKREWRNALLFSAAPNLFLLLATLATLGGNMTSSIQSGPPSSSEQRGRTDADDISLDDFNRLREGMTYAEVTTILGKQGSEMSRSTLADITTVMYSWEGPGIANMNAMFQNDRLISKAQFGLK
jgi:hypothetical protein